MRTFWMILLVALIPALPVPARAQSGGPSGIITPHKAEFGVHGGYAMTWSRNVYLTGTTQGELDIKDSGYWGLTLDFNVGPGKQIELLYRRQDSEITFDPPLTPEQGISDAIVEYWHVGGLGGVPRGDFMPYGLVTLGATHVSYDAPLIEDDWMFSMIFGLGAKKYMGETFGIRAQAQFPFTVIEGSGSIACGSGGCFSTIGGYGVWQFDFGGGVFLQF